MSINCTNLSSDLPWYKDSTTIVHTTRKWSETHITTLSLPISVTFEDELTKTTTTTYLVHYEALTFITYVDHESHAVTPHVTPVTIETKTSKIEPTELTTAFTLAVAKNNVMTDNKIKQFLRIIT